MVWETKICTGMVLSLAWPRLALCGTSLDMYTMCIGERNLLQTGGRESWQQFGRVCQLEGGSPSSSLGAHEREGGSPSTSLEGVCQLEGGSTGSSHGGRKGVPAEVSECTSWREGVLAAVLELMRGREGVPAAVLELTKGMVGVQAAVLELMSEMESLQKSCRSILAAVLEFTRGKEGVPAEFLEEWTSWTEGIPVAVLVFVSMQEVLSVHFLDRRDVSREVLA